MRGCEPTTLGGAATGCPRRRTVLVAEDEYYAAEDLCRELSGLGATVIGPAPILERALELIEQAEKIDAAILDLNLGGEMIFPAADLRTDGSVPFLFTPGYDRPAIPSRFAKFILCEKPIAQYAEQCGQGPHPSGQSVEATCA